MKCPVCESVDLTMADRQGVEIDYCPKCRGVWLDRGELDKIIDRAGSAPRQPAADHAGDRPTSRHAEQHSGSYGYKGKKKKSLLSELFDF